MFHIDLEATTTVEEAHTIVSTLEARVKDQLGFEATVHIEPRRKE